MTEVEKLKDRYVALVHAMQSGVAMLMHHEPGETEPKHLRVGVNSALCDSGALAELLLAKGVFTEEEYLKAICTTLERDVKSYESKLEAIYGRKVTLV